MFKFAQNRAQGTKMAQPGGHQEHGQFSIDTYRLKTNQRWAIQGNSALFNCVSILDMTSQNMIYDVSIWNVYYMYVIFWIWQCSAMYVIAIHAVPQIYLNIKMSVFEAKNENT